MGSGGRPAICKQFSYHIWASATFTLLDKNNDRVFLMHGESMYYHTLNENDNLLFIRSHTNLQTVHIHSNVHLFCRHK